MDIELGIDVGLSEARVVDIEESEDSEEEDHAGTEVTEDELDINQNKGTNQSLSETIKEMFMENKSETEEDSEAEEEVSLDVMMRSLSKDQVDSLVLLAQQDLVKVSSDSSSYKVNVKAQLTI